MVTTRRVLGIADAGDSTHFGTDDVDFINLLLTGSDQSSTASVDMATTWKFRNQRAKHANPGNTFNYIVNTSAITADRNVSYPLLLADDTYLFQNASQSALAYDNFPSVSKEGTFDVLGSNTAALDGSLTGYTITGAGSITSVYDTAEGMTLACATTATANLNAGLVSPSAGVGMGRRLTNMRMKARMKVDSTTSCRLYMGFTSQAALPISDTPLANTDSGAIVGFRSTDANYTILWNNGGGAPGVGVTGLAKDANFHTWEIKFLAGSDILISRDGNLVSTISAAGNIPATTTNLFFNCVAQTTTTTARTLTIRYIEGEADR